MSNTPFTNQLTDELNRLQGSSQFECQLSSEAMGRHEKLLLKNGISSDPFHRNPLQLINTYSSCQNCHQAFQMDSYGKGCLHDCIYCFAKVDAEENGVWNSPTPLPLNFSDLWKVFFQVFETDQKNPWRGILEKRIPLRIGANSDSFMAIDRNFKVTREVLRLLNHYHYPYFVVTRGEAIANDDYLGLLDPKLAAVHLSIPSLNSELTKLLEPAAPSPAARLDSLKAINQAGIWSIVRINPLFPRFKDGHFSQRNGVDDKPLLDYFSFDLIDAVAEQGAKGILAGFVSLKAHTVTALSEKLGTNLWDLIDPSNPYHGERFLFSKEEMRSYYDLSAKRAKKNNIEFTTCYLGTGEEQYFVNKDLWSNSKDCCNIRDRVPAHKSDSSEISFIDKFSYNHSDANFLVKYLTLFCYGLITIILKTLKKGKA